MPLTDVQIRKAKPAEKPYKLNDGNGLHLYVSAAGGKTWRYRYEFEGKELLLTIGRYPAISLADAREERAAARAALKAGRNPTAEKQRIRSKATVNSEPEPSGPTFEAVAREWYDLNKGQWTDTHSGDVLRSLEKDIFPGLGDKPIASLDAPTTLGELRKIEARGAVETARRIRQRMSAVFAYAIASGIATHDPAAQVTKAMAPIVRKGRQPAITDLEGVQEVLRRGEGAPAHPVTKLALRLLALTAIRPGELRGARWDELQDLDGRSPRWVIPAERMKMKKEHEVPLSRQAVDAIKALKPLSGRGVLLFPMSRHAHKPLSENAIGYLSLIHI